MCYMDFTWGERKRRRERKSATRGREKAMRQNVNNQGIRCEGYIRYIVVFFPLFHRFEKFETEKLRKTNICKGGKIIFLLPL